MWTSHRRRKFAPWFTFSYRRYSSFQQGVRKLPCVGKAHPGFRPVFDGSLIMWLFRILFPKVSPSEHPVIGNPFCLHEDLIDVESTVAECTIGYWESVLTARQQSRKDTLCFLQFYSMVNCSSTIFYPTYDVIEFWTVTGPEFSKYTNCWTIGASRVISQRTCRRSRDVDNNIW